jgi:ATP-dependent DNA helicase RecG
MRTFCAMLNHRSGRVLFGVEPDGRLAGQHVSGRTVEDVAQELREIDPPAFPNVDRVDLGGGYEVSIVSVAAGQNRPYTHRGKAYRRVGNTSQAMSREEYMAAGLDGKNCKYNGMAYSGLFLAYSWLIAVGIT